ncbi:hypothetical protein AAG570_010756 [Ranatra chinensis]|uniref:limulus clotting factor C n=1 Tax=Ranatra chinensis TaxID=642074 RepID=A0ABD0YNG1_9HEMI
MYFSDGRGMNISETCGISSLVNFRQPRSSNNSVLYGRIVNGKKSEKGAWPWQVSLQVLHPRIGLITHWCGAVLIHPFWIITAAHCIHKYNSVDIFNLPLPALWTAVLGEWDRGVEEKTESRVPIEEIKVHRGFNNYQNDIALMRLSRVARGVGVVCLEGGLESVRVCTATGWGRTLEAGPMAPTLRQARIPLHDNQLCKNKYGPSVHIHEGHICAGKLDGSTGACVGDSGGPLQCSRRDGRWFLAGITSFGSGCAKIGYPDVYTRLSYYLPWIYEEINK